jgi:MFS family permease
VIKRFSLYGFLKNQRYFEPFIILFFLQQGLSFTQIGLLVAFRELSINLLEIPSGAMADLWGRRRSMLFSFVAYIIAFTIFGFSRDYWQFFAAMFFFAVGEAFRTGTHKAIIFSWLRQAGRLDEKTQVYGYTRSWSKIGSAVSTLLAAGFVLLTNNYACVFYFSIIPYALGLWNLATYPRELDGRTGGSFSLRETNRHLWESVKMSFRLSRLRRLVVESMAFEGVFKAVSDYLQPVLKSTALLIPLGMGFEETRRSAVLVGVVYFILYLASAYASRKSHRLVEIAGDEEKSSRLLWIAAAVSYLALVPLLYFEYYYAAILGFVVLYVLQNFWRPVLISRFDRFATETHGATVLSIESQAKSLSTMMMAPLLGAAVDFVTTGNLGGQFWPVGALAALAALGILLSSGKKKG